MKRVTAGVGLQLRLGTTITELARKALRLELSCFQCFLTVQETQQSFILKKQDKEDFIALREQHFGPLFLHASYVSNLANPAYVSHPRLEHEVRIAEQLGFSHLIVHPGAYPSSISKEEGLAAVARSIDVLCSKSSHLIITLENVAHGKRAIGGDLTDLGSIVSLVAHPERVQFCLDTAHAHSFGYDVITEKGRAHFLDTFDQVCGKERLALVHLNDTTQSCGNCIDNHCIIGAGVFGHEALSGWFCDPRLAAIPFLLEMPELSEYDEWSIVKQVAEWRNVSSHRQPQQSQQDLFVR